MKTWKLAALLLAPVVFGPVYACSARQTAKTEYDLQSKDCLQIYTTKADQTSCLEYVRNKWNAAGAPPAATDGGDQ